jgi:hypothetical protein
MKLSLKPPFLCCFNRRRRVANAAPSVIELLEVRIDSHQWENDTFGVALVERRAAIPEVIT